MTVDVLTREERVALARLALAHAERRTGARSVRVHEPAGRSLSEPGPEPGSEPRSGPGPATGSAPGPDETAALRAVPEHPGAVPRSGAPAASLLTTERPPLPVPQVLAPLLPDGLRRGATTTVLGSTSLALAVLGTTSAAGSWAAAVGQPSLGLLAAAEAGVALDRLAVVPRPGPDAALVLAALLDGVDVVLVGPEVRLVDADRRRLSARARERGTVLLTTVPWPGAQVVLSAGPGRWSGVGDGHGRLRVQRLPVARAGRAGAGVPLEVELTFPLAAPSEVPEQRPATDAAPVPRPGSGPGSGTVAPVLRLVG